MDRLCEKWHGNDGWYTEIEEEKILCPPHFCVGYGQENNDRRYNKLNLLLNKFVFNYFNIF